MRPLPPAPPASSAVVSTFTRLAVVCFVLVGALILRMVTELGVLPPLAGMVVGLAYAAGLMVTPRLLDRITFVRTLGPFFQACGAALAPLVVMEMTRRYGALSGSAATVVVNSSV